MKNVALFLVSPFIGLAYAVALPFVGMYMFLNLGTEAAIKKVEELSANEKTTVTQ